MPPEDLGGIEPVGVTGTARDTGNLFEAIFSTDAVRDATSAEGWTAALLTFEAELAAAEADTGILPAEAARAIAEAARSLHLGPGQLDEGTRSAGNPVVPLVRILTTAVAEAGSGTGGARAASAPGDPGADSRAGHASWVHFGATSQDAMDTSAMLVARGACRHILADAGAAADAAAALARGHRTTLMAGRTLLQQAVPIIFGLKAAGWLVGVVEATDVLARVLAERLAVQLGGAAGTLAPLGERGPDVAARLADRLSLADPLLPWHTDRGRVTELAAALVGLANAAAKVALDVVLLAQSEVAEASEDGGAGHGGSSTMPHKANPVTAVTALAAARRAQGAAAVLLASAVQEHERAATGGWHAEWPSLTDLLRATSACVAGARRVLEHLAVDPARMAANLERSGGVLLAERVALDLAPELGRARAAELVAVAVRQARAAGRTLRDTLGDVPEITARRAPPDLDRLCDPTGYLGAGHAMVDRALAHYDARTRRAAGGRAGR